ncbi:hypothetical protein ACHAW5_005492 [Stephanodiscus triporus]|uniref:Uncharacterized protein n=1 Tax=Stephanodiscus triporus TaxID=2934178 RepID=A0ABD3MGJ0_9STRA
MARSPSKRTSQRLGMAQAATQREREQRDRLAALYAARGQEQSAQSETSNLGDVALPGAFLSALLPTLQPLLLVDLPPPPPLLPLPQLPLLPLGLVPHPPLWICLPQLLQRSAHLARKGYPGPNASPASASSPSARAASGLSSAATASATDSTEAAVSGTSGTSLAAVALLTTGTTGDGSPQEHTAAPDVAEHQAPRRLRSATRQGV